MTVASETNRSGPYNGNGVTTAFDYDFRIVNQAHLQVIKAAADGTETTLVLTTDYTVSGVGNAGGGQITCVVAPATGTTITILRKVPFTQETDLENQGAYYAETVEAALDLAAMRDQQLEERMNRAILVPASEDDSGGELAASLAAGILRLAESADEIDTVAGIYTDVETVANIAPDVALLADVSGVLSGTASAVRMDEKVFTGDGVQTTWTLDRAPGVDENILVWVGGAIQNVDDYSVSGTTLTITPAVADMVEIRTLIMTLVTANDIQGAAAAAAASAAAAAAAETAAEAAAAAAAAASLQEPTGFSVAGNGTAGPYNVGVTIGSDYASMVFVSGVLQRPTVDYTYVGSNVTFLTLTPAADDVIHGYVFAVRGIGAPGNGSVGVSVLTAEVKSHIPSLSDNAALVDESPTQLKLNYFKARASRHVKAFGSTLTAVGGGNASVDTAALQAAMDSQEIIDLTGAVLQVNNTINVAYAGANISSMMAGRVGTTASSRLLITDDALPKLFNCSSTNFEASGFFIEGGAANTTTVFFHFERAAGSASDIDAVLSQISTEKGAKLFHIYGRGLRVEGCVIANVGTCVGDIDWPASWTPNGASNDTQETGMRAYHFSDLRFHGCASGVRNIGANKLNCRGVIMDNILADIGLGGGAFVGAAVESMFTTIESQINATNAGLLFDIHAGSKKSDFIGFKGGGFKSASTTRLSRNLINIAATTADEVSELHFIGGSLGPCNRNAVQIFGGGKAKNILFKGVSFERCGLESSAYAPISLFNSGDTFTELTLKLSACNFDTTDTSPTHIIGGTNSAAFTVYKDTLTTKPAAVPWAQSNVVLA